jgi:thiol:disulfide interchange protein DsbD
MKFDKTFQRNVETYRGNVTIQVPVDANGAFTLTAISQGCADAGLCYAPQESKAVLSTTALAEPPQPASNSGVSIGLAQTGSTTSGGMGQIETVLRSGRLLLILPLFFLLGLGLSFTPCVLPMVPILSAIIVGEGAKVGRTRGFILSLIYALGMAIVYTALGIAAGLIGEGLSATLQNPWILGSFALLMVGLALSMFDVYQLQMPAFVQERLMTTSGQQRPGKLLGVFAMGSLSALIVGPCVAAPLAGALVYISQTRDVTLGGSALFAMAAGMSVPLLLIGVSAGALLPRAGAWMGEVKRFFGVLMLAVALWMVTPILPPVLQMLAWVALALGYGAYLLYATRTGWIGKAMGIAFAAVGLMELVGVATGGRDVLEPLGHLSSSQSPPLTFTRVKSSAELDLALRNNPGKVVMLDFYADWCVSCKEMEKLTFTAPVIRASLDRMVVLQADVTANNADDKALLKRFHLFGPPGILFFKQGSEMANARVIGYQPPDKFAQSLTAVGDL